MNTPRSIAAVLAAAVSFVLPVFGEALTFTLDKSLSEGGGVINWKEKSSYVNASRAPEANDTVIIPSGMTAVLSSTDSESWNLVSSLKRITPEDGAKFEVNVDSGEAVLECQISWYDSTINTGNIAADLKKGFLVKKGSGALQLKRRDTSLYVSNLYYDYFVHIDIVEGSVRLPTGENDAKGYAVGAVNLAKLAEFYMANWGGGTGVTKDKITDFCDITGEGTVKGGNKDFRVKLVYTGLSGRTGEFFGSFDGKIWCNFNRNFNYYGNSLNQLTDATRVFNGVALGVVNKSIMGGGNIGGKGYLKYIGDNGSEFQPPAFWVAYDWLSFDAGNAGGIVLASENRLISVGENNKLLPFILEGENSSVPCVFNNCVNYGSSPSTDRLASIVNIVKRGSGTWRINDNAKNQMNGAFYVENGILQFESIAEKGVKCSLGYSTNLYQNVFASTKDNAHYKYEVPWAFLLGGEDTEGIMEYVGEADAECFSRPFAVRSRGGIYASSSQSLKLSLAGFSAAGEGRKTLVVGGENTGDNVLKDVSDAKYSLDGKGSLGLEKRGGGVWRLSGEQNFTGPLEVKSGTLIVDNAPAGAPFRYLRFYMKENAFSACINNTADGYYASVKDDDSNRWKGTNGETEFNFMHLLRLRFFDKDGILAVSNCVRTAQKSVGEGSLPENTFTFVGKNIPDYLPGTNQEVTNMFLSEDIRDEPHKNPYRAVFRLTKMPKLDDPSTWACITLRLPNDTPEVFGYDVRMYKSSYGLENGKNFEELGGRSLVSWEVHGSVDGVNFEKLHEVNSFKMRGGSTGRTSDYWAYDQNNANAGNYDYSHEGGKFYHFSHTRSLNGTQSAVFDNVESISVAPGAVLEVHGAKLEIGTLKIGADGAGTFKNVKFAESGKIDIAWNGERSQVFSANFVNAQDVANISKWEITINGEKDTAGRIDVRDGYIAYRRSGFAVLLR